MNFKNEITIVFFSLLCLSIIIKIILDIENYFYRKKRLNFIPEDFKSYIDKEKLTEINNYSNDKLIFELVQYIFDKALIIAVLLTGLIPLFYNFVESVTGNIYLIAAIFFGAYFLMDLILSIPFSLYFNFVIEKKYNFNKMTIKIWVSDFIKNIILSVILGGALLFPLVFIIYNFNTIWWILVWGFILIFSLLMQIIFPTVIAPLFNKFTPLKDVELKNKIIELFGKTKINISDIYEKDESKRSSHSNAYFVGIGKTKRIVLYDSLLKNHNHSEILSILAHEIGHYKKKHILKSIVISSVIMLIGLFISYLLIDREFFYNAFGLIKSEKILGLFLFMIISGPVSFFMTPIFSAISRHNEYQADAYSKEIYNDNTALKVSLIKMSVENLSNIFPSKLYSTFYYSHPPVIDRIKKL